jgi:hypothetical protein
MEATNVRRVVNEMLVDVTVPNSDTICQGGMKEVLGKSANMATQAQARLAPSFRLSSASPDARFRSHVNGRASQ